MIISSVAAEEREEEEGWEDTSIQESVYQLNEYISAVPLAGFGRL